MDPPAVGPGRPSVADGLRNVTGVRGAPTPRHTEPEVLVPSGQMEAIRRFGEILRESPIDSQLLPEIAEVVPSPPRLSEIEIAPLKIGSLTWGGSPGETDMRDRNQ
jgi:hypothetical protein